MYNQKNDFPWWEKYTLSIEEAAVYFGIGEHTLRNFLKDNMENNFVLQIGNHIRIKKKEFEKYISTELSIM